MMQSQYMRVESKAGGVACTNREFIRTAHTVLSKAGKSLAMKKRRHRWLREGLKLKAEYFEYYLAIV